MEKLHADGGINVAAGGNALRTYQIDGGEVEAQVKRIMFSAAAWQGSTSKGTTYQLGLFQKQPTAAADFTQEEVVISGAIGNQYVHNETITMRVPKDWWIGILFVNHNGAGSDDLSYNLQLNYKVLN